MTSGGMGGKGWQGNFFENFEVGQKIVCPPERTISAGDVAVYVALTGDRTARFCGPEGVVHPLVTFHTVFGQTVRPVSLNARANLGYAGMVWGDPVRIGDTLTTQLEVVGLKENSNRQTGVVYVRTVGRNQRGAEILSYWRWVMVKKRTGAAIPRFNEAVMPSLPASVDPRQLRGLDQRVAPTAMTWGRFAWEDYRIGERIHHYDGTTIQSSDHMSFARLFQNSAKVHFDARLMQGKQLVYGGVVISHGYAMALNGLERRLGIAAINACSHTNPVYAGDTLYAFTDVLDSFDPGDGYAAGALRLRLVCVKNEDPGSATVPFEMFVTDPVSAGKRALHPAVVLDLDYWEIMPKRATLR